MPPPRAHLPEPRYLHLTLRYVGVLVVIALLAALIFAISYSVTLEQQKDGEVIRVSGQQRTLALEIEMLGGQLLYAADEQARLDLQDRLTEALENLERTHLILAYGDLGDGKTLPMSEKVQELFFDAQSNLDGKIRAYIENGFAISFADENDTRAIRKARLGLQALIQMRPEIDAGLDQVVAAYQLETDTKISKLKAIQQAGLFATLAVLLTAGLAIFRPMVRKIRDYFVELGDLNDEMAIRNVELEMAKDKFEKQAVELVAMSEDLNWARIDAENARAAMGGFMSSMSHELRTPLNAILGFSQLMEFDKHSPLTPSQEEGIAIIKQSGQHLLDLINELLDLSKIEAGTFQVDLEAFDPQPLIEECLHLTAMQAESADIKLINLTQGNAISPVFADMGRVRQVLLNFITNAIKYNSDHGTVQLECHDDDGFVRISVTDTGQGLSSEQLQKLFRPYVRLGAEQTKIEGTGLGLTIAKKLVDVMGGEIGVNSETGHGSTFWFRLPMAA
ncbi:sensor histidine kinase [Magnetovibrio sp.]|uniref:sensor histidine kinase n=1 Tax=Magnetovibrio sp. TaxID=2024836 RepID=UPI002F954602